MVEVILFLVVFILFFFLPVHFRIRYQKESRDDSFFFELSFLGGLLRRQKTISLLKPVPTGIKLVQKSTGNWFFLSRSKTEEIISPFDGNLDSIKRFFYRYQHFGLGVTLLFYFLPAKYHRWLLVTENLENKGCFTKFVWITKFGTSEAASTSIMCGLLWGLKANLIGYLTRNVGLKGKPKMAIYPDFQSLRLDMLFDCIFRVELGYIIIAAVVARFKLRGLKGGVKLERASN